jgi:hypothetical protein
VEPRQIVPVPCCIREFSPYRFIYPASDSSNTYPSRHAILNPEVDPLVRPSGEGSAPLLLRVAPRTTCRTDTQG